MLYYIHVFFAVCKALRLLINFSYPVLWITTIRDSKWNNNWPLFRDPSDLKYFDYKEGRKRVRCQRYLWWPSQIWTTMICSLITWSMIYPLYTTKLINTHNTHFFFTNQLRQIAILWHIVFKEELYFMYDSTYFNMFRVKNIQLELEYPNCEVTFVTCKNLCADFKIIPKPDKIMSVFYIVLVFISWVTVLFTIFK